MVIPIPPIELQTTNTQVSGKQSRGNVIPGLTLIVPHWAKLIAATSDSAQATKPQRLYSHVQTTSSQWAKRKMIAVHVEVPMLVLNQQEAKQ